MPFKKGNSGKPKGAVTKNSKLVKDVFAEVFTMLQEHETANLKTWGSKNPTDFYKLASKLIPIQLAGDHENPLAFTLKEALKFEDDQTESEV